MAVPESVRKVERPVNTIVEDSGRNTKYRYAVRERGEIVYESGSNPRPKNGRVIGHITDGMFVPRTENTAKEPDMFSYGAAAFAYSFSQDLYRNLLAVYPIRDSSEIIAIAMLKVIKPRIASNRYSTEYERTFVNVWYPGCAMSRNSITDFYCNKVIKEHREHCENDVYMNYHYQSKASFGYTDPQEHHGANPGVFASHRLCDYTFRRFSE